MIQGELAYVVHVRTPGSSGGEVRSYQMAEALGEVCDTLRLYGQVDTNFSWSDRVVPNRLLRPYPLGVYQMLRDLRHNDIEIVVERFQFPPFNVASLAQMLRRKPYILEIHGFPIEEFKLRKERHDPHADLLSRVLATLPVTWWNRIQNFIFNRAAHFIVTSSGTQTILEQRGVDPGEITVVYNKVDGTRFDPQQVTRAEARQRFGLPLDAQIVLYAGTLSHEELHIILESLQVLMQTNPQLQTLIVGAGSVEPLRQSAADLDIPVSRLYFREPVYHTEMPGLLAAADVVLAPYSLSSRRFRGAFHYSPLKIMEALAMEKPVVTVSADELHTVFDAVPNVIFAESGNAQAWQLGIAQALCPWPEGELEKGRAFVMAGYQWSDAAREYAAVITAVQEACLS